MSAIHAYSNTSQPLNHSAPAQSVATQPLPEPAPFVDLLDRQAAPQNREAIIEATNNKVEATRSKVDPEAEFKEFLDKTPAERMRELILKELGLSEESLAALPPEERQAIEDMIANLIEAKIQEQAQEKLEEFALKAKIAQLKAQGTGEAAPALLSDAQRDELSAALNSALNKEQQRREQQ